MFIQLGLGLLVRPTPMWLDEMDMRIPETSSDYESIRVNHAFGRWQHLECLVPDFGNLPITDDNGPVVDRRSSWRRIDACSCNHKLDITCCYASGRVLGDEKRGERYGHAVLRPVHSAPPSCVSL